MQSIRLLVTYCIAIPFVMSAIVAIGYAINLGFLAVFVRSHRSIRFLIDFVFVVVFATIVVIVINAPLWFEKPDAQAFKASSWLFRWWLNGMAILLPTLLLVFFRKKFLGGLADAARRPWRDDAFKDDS